MKKFVLILFLCLPAAAADIQGKLEQLRRKDQQAISTSVWCINKEIDVYRSAVDELRAGKVDLAYLHFSRCVVLIQFDELYHKKALAYEKRTAKLIQQF